MSTAVELARDWVYSAIVHLTPRAANVVMFILIGRMAGPSEAGVFALATTYLLIFIMFTRGMDDLVTRQVSRQPEQAASYLTSFSLFRLILSTLFYGILVVLVAGILNYPESTTTTILILTLCLIPDSLAYLALGTLLGIRRFAAPAIILVVITFLKLILAGVIFYLDDSLISVAWVWVLGSLAGMLLMYIATFRRVGWVSRGNWFNWRLIRSNWGTSWIFLLITVLITFETQTDTILLSIFRSEAEVGWYNAATTIILSLALIPQAFRMSVYPVMARLSVQSPAKLPVLYHRSLRYLGMLVLPMVAGVFVLSPQIVNLVFGIKFLPTVTLVRILIPALIFFYLNVPSSRMILVNDRQLSMLIFMIATAALNVTLNLALDPRLGPTGAAIARLSSSSLFFILAYLYVKRYLVSANLLGLLARPLLAALGMAGIVWLMRDLSLFISIPTGIASYLGILWLMGGITTEDLALLRQAVTRNRNPSAPHHIG